MECSVQYLVRRISRCRWRQFVYGPFLSSLCRAENVRIHAHADLPQVGEYQRTHILSLIEFDARSYGRFRQIKRCRVARPYAALAKHLADPKTTLIDRLVVQAWGTKPV